MTIRNRENSFADVISVAQTAQPAFQPPTARGLDDEIADQLLRREIERQALERAAGAVEALAGAEAYRQAWRKAARVIRDLKP